MRAGGPGDSSSRERLKIVEESLPGPSAAAASGGGAPVQKRSAGAVRVLNLEEVPVRTPEDVFKLVQQGECCSRSSFNQPFHYYYC